MPYDWEKWLSRTTIGLVIITIILSMVQLLFKLSVPIVAICVSFYMNSLIGKTIVTSIISSGIVVLAVMVVVILEIKIPSVIIGVLSVLPLGVLFLIVWYIVYIH